MVPEGSLSSEGHIMRRNWLVKLVAEGRIEGKTEVTRRRRRRRKQPLDILSKRAGTELKDEALNRIRWRIPPGWGNGCRNRPRERERGEIEKVRESESPTLAQITGWKPLQFHNKDPQYCLLSEGRNPARKIQRISVQVDLVSRPSCVRQKVGVNKRLQSHTK